jgi:hypothetical protein
VATAYDDAISLDKRRAERRQMFMPSGYEAMREGEHGEGDLLGFREAYQERVYLEAKRAHEEEDDEGVSAELLKTLSLEEKNALRKLLVERLGRGGEE